VYNHTFISYVSYVWALLGLLTLVYLKNGTASYACHGQLVCISQVSMTFYSMSYKRRQDRLHCIMWSPTAGMHYTKTTQYTPMLVQMQVFHAHATADSRIWLFVCDLHNKKYKWLDFACYLHQVNEYMLQLVFLSLKLDIWYDDNHTCWWLL